VVQATSHLPNGDIEGAIPWHRVLLDTLRVLGTESELTAAVIAPREDFSEFQFFYLLCCRLCLPATITFLRIILWFLLSFCFCNRAGCRLLVLARTPTIPSRLPGRLLVLPAWGKTSASASLTFRMDHWLQVKAWSTRWELFHPVYLQGIVREVWAHTLFHS